MQNAGDQKVEMEELKKVAAEENKVLEKRKKAIDVEMAEVSVWFNFIVDIDGQFCFLHLHLNPVGIISEVCLT